MAFSNSVNIERDFGKSTQYIVTANARQSIGKIVNHFKDGKHSFCLIGSYGSGKSSFIVALENCLRGVTSNDESLIVIDNQFNGFKKFEFLNIVGEYQPLSKILSSKLNVQDSEEKKIFSELNHKYSKVQNEGKFLFIVIDEFGKILEHAAKNNPEKEMYFLQLFFEWVNDSNNNCILLTTLHQGFGAYAKRLSVEQRQEWTKVKGRLQDIIFTEPIEQLLNLTARKLQSKKVDDFNVEAIKQLYDLAKSSKFLNNTLHISDIESLYPLDIFAAYVMTKANQRYGQNERTLFTFLESTGKGTISEFKSKQNLLYNLVDVFDFISYNFYSYLQEVNEDSINWSAIHNSIERIEGMKLSNEKIEEAINIVKIIGLLNIFSPNGIEIDSNFLKLYCKYALNLSHISETLDRLEKGQIIRFAKYKNKYILYEGSDIDIQSAIFEAARKCRQTSSIVNSLANIFEEKITLANAHFFKTGTPRFFRFLISNEPIEKVDKGEIDGYINILFGEDKESLCKDIHDEAIIYCIFKNVTDLKRHLFEIDKLNWVKDNYITDQNDRIVIREIDNLLDYEKTLLNKILKEGLYSDNVEWIFNGDKIYGIKSDKKLVSFLSIIADTIYPYTPVYRNELINKYRPNGVMSLARQNYLNALLDKLDKPNLGFDDNKFPPEKTIYLSLLLNTGILVNKQYQVPSDFTFAPLWNTCNDFLKSSMVKSKKVSELYNILSQKPFRLKPGFLDVWIPTFLILRKDDYALYSGNQYIPNINKEVLDLILRSPANFTIKSFSVDGVRKEFFDKYREAINLKGTILNTRSFIETIRPFLTFYKKLNNYAKTTKDISSLAKGFRDVIAKATDPEKTFFEELPESLGFKELALEQNSEAIESFVEVLHNAIRELRNCYIDFVNSIEKEILSQLKIEETDYADYTIKIKNRFNNVKTQLMPLSIRNFYNRLVGNYEDKISWVEALAYVILNKPLQDIKDADKPALFKGIKDMLFVLDDYMEMHKSDDIEMMRLHITENYSKPFVKQIVLPKQSLPEVSALEERIRAVLTDDITINTAAILKILKFK